MPEPADLFAAINRGDREGVAAMVEDAPSLASARNEAGVSAVLAAAYAGKRDILAWLADRADLDVFDLAALGRAADLRAALRAKPALARAFSADGFTALQLAAFLSGSGEAVRALLDARVDVAAHAQNGMRIQAIHAALAAQNAAAVRELLRAGTPLNDPQQAGFRPLHAPAQQGDWPTCDLLIRQGADPSIANDAGATPADAAEAAGHADLARRLRTAASGA